MKENVEQIRHFQKRFVPLVREIKMMEQVTEDAGDLWTAPELNIVFARNAKAQSDWFQITEGRDPRAAINIDKVKGVVHRMNLHLRNAGINAPAQLQIKENVVFTK